MGRRKSAEKIEIQAKSYLAAREKLEGKEKWDVCLPAQEFSGLVYPLRVAAKKAGLKLTSGRILRKNNQGGCSILCFPQEVELYPQDDGEFKTCWNNVIIVRTAYNKPRNEYSIKYLNRMNQIKVGELYDLCSGYVGKSEGRMLKEEEFNCLMAEYARALAGLALAEIPPLVNLALPQFYDGKFSNFTPTYRKFFEIDFDAERKRKKDSKRRKAFLANNIESILFSATLFSLCKPLFQMCKIKDAHIMFALQLLMENDVDVGLELKSIEEQERQLRPYWELNDYIELWCDFRPFEAKKDGEIISDVVNLKFRWNWSNEQSTAAYKHLGFPIVYSNYKKLDWGDIEPEPYKKAEPTLTKTQLQKINQASCLPILLPFRKPQKPYEEKNCFTITVSPSQGEDIDSLLSKSTYKDERYKYHEWIKSIYYKFMDLLRGKELKTIKKGLQKAYKEALDDVGTSTKTLNMEQRHMACLLGALYFASQTFEEAEIEDSYTQFCGHIRNVKRFLGHQASVSDFSAFIKEVLQSGSEYHSVLFGEDENGIYLRYKTYWEAFETYCSKCNVVLQQNALQFRKQELIPKGYIQPQYQVKDPRKYVRYDYRKKIDGKKETVLNISRRVLKVESSKN